MVAVPETPVHKNRQPVFGKNNVGCTRKVLGMKPEPISFPMERSTYNKFWLGMLLPNASHTSMSLDVIKVVHVPLAGAGYLLSQRCVDQYTLTWHTILSV